MPVLKQHELSGQCALVATSIVPLAEHMSQESSALVPFYSRYWLVPRLSATDNPASSNHCQQFFGTSHKLVVGHGNEKHLSVDP